MKVPSIPMRRVPELAISPEPSRAPLVIIF